MRTLAEHLLELLWLMDLIESTAKSSKVNQSWTAVFSVTSPVSVYALQ